MSRPMTRADAALKNLTVVTVYENMTQSMVDEWCRQILKGDPESESVVLELRESGHVVIQHSDPNPESKARKTTSFTLGDA